MMTLIAYDLPPEVLSPAAADLGEWRVLADAQCDFTIVQVLLPLSRSWMDVPSLSEERMHSVQRWLIERRSASPALAVGSL